jgi:hypothetical protein
LKDKIHSTEYMLWLCIKIDTNQIKIKYLSIARYIGNLYSLKIISTNTCNVSNPKYNLHIFYYAGPILCLISQIQINTLRIWINIACMYIFMYVVRSWLLCFLIKFYFLIRMTLNKDIRHRYTHKLAHPKKKICNMSANGFLLNTASIAMMFSINEIKKRKLSWKCVICP